MTTKKFMTLDEMFAPIEAERLAAAKAEIAAEKAAWDALPQSEKDRINAERDKRWEDFDAACQASDDEEEDSDDEEEDSDDE